MKLYELVYDKIVDVAAGAIWFDIDNNIEAIPVHDIKQFGERDNIILVSESVIEEHDLWEYCEEYIGIDIETKELFGG